MPAPSQLHFVFVLVALLGCGLITGVFFTFSTFVMKALTRLSPEEGMKAMQSINITILRSYFIYVFIGTAVVCALLLVWSIFQWNKMGSEYVLIGSGLYLLGSLMVTGMFNVPKNDILAKVDASLASSEGVWNDYVEQWMIWNHIRTIASLLAAVSFALSIY